MEAVSMGAFESECGGCSVGGNQRNVQFIPRPWANATVTLTTARQVTSRGNVIDSSRESPNSSSILIIFGRLDLEDCQGSFAIDLRWSVSFQLGFLSKSIQ